MNNKNNFQVPHREIAAIAKGAGIVFIGAIIGGPLRYIFQIILARNLGAELFGLFILGFAVINVAGMISEFGLPNGIIRYIALYQGERDEKRVKGTIVSAVRVAILSSILVAFSVFLFSKTIAFSIFQKIELTEVLKFLTLGIPFATLTTMLVFSCQGLKIMKYKVLVREIFEPLMRITLVIILFLLGWKLYGVIIAYLIPIPLGTLLAFYYLKKIFPQITKKKVQPKHETRKLLNFSWPLLIVQFVALLILRIDTLMLGFFKTSQDIGIYNAAFRTALLGIIVITSFNSIFSPVISDLYNKKDLDRLKNYFKIVAKWIFTFSLPLFLIMIFFAQFILNIFGKQFIPGAQCLIILSISWLIHSSVGSSGQMITMTGRSKLQLMNALGSLLLNVILNVALIPKYGILGAAISTAVSISIINIIITIEVYIILKMHPYRLDFLKPVIAGGLSLLIMFLSIRYILQNQSGVILGALILLASYFGLIIMFGLREEDKIVLNKIKTIFLSPR